MGILTDIYNTVARFFRTQDVSTGEDASKSVAQNRLKLVLMQDRTNLTPKVLEQMRGEMIDLLSKYLEMDKDLLELNFEQEGDQVALMLSIPVIRAKDEDEIEQAKTEEIQEEEENDENHSNDEEIIANQADDNSETSSIEDSTEINDSPKPKKRRSKKVTAPEELEGTTEVSNAESQEEIIQNETAEVYEN